MSNSFQKIPFLRKLQKGILSVWNNLSLQYKRLQNKYQSILYTVKGYIKVKKAARYSPIKIIIGAGPDFADGWTETNIQYLNLLIPKHWKRYFKKNSIDAILSEHVWEHLSNEDGIIAAKQCYEYLKPGGYLRVAVPDGNHPDPDYINHVKVGGIGPGADDHKVLYNYESFRNVFLQAGFRVELLEYFDAHGNFQFTNWDPQKGKIRRSKEFDRRNKNGNLGYTSIILDCYKDS